jgi:predicted transposase/invertase (TIGR01784 family)
MPNYHEKQEQAGIADISETDEKKASSEREKHDELFKLLLENFFLEFIELFFPQVSSLIDSKHIIFMPQEVIVDILAKDKHIVDILVETRFKDEEGIVLIHVENQSQKVPGYNEKMFRYYSRLYEKYRKKILPVIVYAHKEKAREAESFEIVFSFLPVLAFNFLAVHLVRENWRDYIRKNNPVAAALLSKMNYTEEEKVSIKIEFSRMMANMQLDLAKSTLLTIFFETYLKLSKEQDKEYQERLPRELTPREVTTFMQLTTSYHEEGRKEGRIEGIKESILDLLQEKDDYHLLSNDLIKRLDSQTEMETLKIILKKAAKALNVKQFLEELASL